jgi:CRP-like cAMP-binding protein
MAADPILSNPVRHLLLKLRARDEVDGREESVLRAAVSATERFPAGTTIIRDGALLNRSALLIDGLVGRRKDLSEGQRQIMELHIAGDFTDLHGFPLKRLDHDVAAMTDATIAWVPHEALRRITETEPHLTRLLWLSTLMDAAIQRERILSIGRRGASARIAQLICELQVRLAVIGLADETGYDLPLTQNDLADATGLTPVHVNRMLRELREAGLMTFRGRRVTIHDRSGLEAAADFDPGYLHLERLPR